MVELREYSPVKEPFTADGLARTIQSAWPESSCSNLERLTSPHLNAVVTLCPLYGQGVLSESRVLSAHNATVDLSRVANKWAAIKTVMTEVSEYAHRVDGSLHVTAVFANKGILYDGTPNESDYKAITMHNEVYQEVLGEYCTEENIDFTYYTFDDLDVSLPRFVNPQQSPPTISDEGLVWMRDESKMIAELNAFNESEGVPVQVTDNKRNRKLIEKLQRINGISRNGAFWVTAGYLAFDYKLPDLIGNNGFYVATERFEPLFGITSMTPGLQDIAKVKLKA